jgi:hypothetical protein
MAGKRKALFRVGQFITHPKATFPFRVELTGSIVRAIECHPLGISLVSEIANDRLCEWTVVSNEAEIAKAQNLFRMSKRAINPRSHFIADLRT